MSVFKCKMCGGTLEFAPGDTVGVCDSCGTKQTLPRLDDEKKANLYDRANHFRRNNDFDKAMGIYEQILNEDNTDAEAYWSLVLCRYGIEYVEDPTSHKRVPTVNRAQYTSIYDDADYKAALSYADAAQRELYEAEAASINEIQKGILAISQKEKPFDVFICYKETDANGRRTQDSVLANDLYHQLTAEGFKVFFSRITLEDKLGTAYEPYIFAALNSAKVMVVLGTKPEYFNAVWVKNEWARYLALIKNGAKKVLIPAYRDMDPYDLPEEFSHLQAQDMSKLGFMQDLIRGIKKLTASAAPTAPAKEAVSAPNAGIEPLLERVFLFLEDGHFDEANEYCEKVLDQNPKETRAYLGKLMAENEVCKKEDLKHCYKPFDDSENYDKILRFGDEALKNELAGYIDHINERNDYEEKDEIYEEAVSLMNAAKTEAAFKEAAAKFAEIPEHRDAAQLKEECFEKAEISRKDAIYANAKALMEFDRIPDYEDAVNLLQSIPGWKDSGEQIHACQKGIEKIKAKEEAERLERERKAKEKMIAEEEQKKRNKKILLAASAVLAVAVIARVLTVYVFIPLGKYNDAVKLKNEGKLEEAIMAFAAMEDYKDSADQILECYYEKGIALQSESKTAEAYTAFRAAEGYKDSAEKASEILKSTVTNANVGDTFIFGAYEQDNDLSNGAESIEWRVLAKEDNKVFLISEYALDCKRYNMSYEDVTWETCSLREWLNGDFLNAAFTANEQAYIADTLVSADKNPMYSTNPGNATTDKIFLLSISDVGTYFQTYEDAKCVPTAFAVANGAYTSSNKAKGGAATCWWWLRSPGDSRYSAAYVRNAGAVGLTGYSVSSVHGSVRPAIWVNLDS